VDEWLREAAQQLAGRTGIEAERLHMSHEEIESLLGAAGRAAHDSGARTNAPLYCYLLGKASALSGLDVSHLQATG
jgi:hypothetical protein